MDSASAECAVEIAEEYINLILNNIPYGDTDSPNVSYTDSIGAASDTEKSELSNTLKSPFKNIKQAKKRLQAYSLAKLTPKNSPKHECKHEDVFNISENANESLDKVAKKGTKEMYPDEKAKNTIAEIEALKKTNDMFDSQNYKLMNRSHSNSREDRQHFIKREIKRRNYRRSESSSKRTPSPENRRHEKDREKSERHDKDRTEKHVEKEETDKAKDKDRTKKVDYPNNWGEYKGNNLTVESDNSMKLKINGNKRCDNKNFLSKFLNFDLPSPAIEVFRYKTVNETRSEQKIVPFQFLRCTSSWPTINYSVNFTKNKVDCIQQIQLFKYIPKDRRIIIQKLMDSSETFNVDESHPAHKPWFPKNWTTIECTPYVSKPSAEPAVALSFLQTYSDDNDEEANLHKLISQRNQIQETICKEIISEGSNLIKKLSKRRKKKRKHDDSSSSEDEAKTKKKRKRKKKKIALKMKNKKSKKHKKTKKPSKKRLKSIKSDTTNNIAASIVTELIKTEKVEVESLLNNNYNYEPKLRNRSTSRKRNASIEADDKKKAIKEEDSASKRTKRRKIVESNTKRSTAVKKEPEEEEQSKKVDQNATKRKRSASDTSETKKEKIEEVIKEESPDTDEYHSHWESDDDLPQAPREKLNTSWESDEEIFERRPHSTPKPLDTVSFEIPLTIQFSRRTAEETPVKVEETKSGEDKSEADSELELLKQERHNLSEERRKLELQKLRIKEMELNADEIKSLQQTHNNENDEFNIDLNWLNEKKGLNVSSSSEKSNPVLENEYEEFLKAVTSTTKKGLDSSSSDSSSSDSSDYTSSSESSPQARKKRKKKSAPIVTDLDELLPKLPEGDAAVMLTPKPVPVPKEEALTTLASPITDNSTDSVAFNDKEKEPVVPIVFTSMTLPTKKPIMLNNTNLKLNDESDEEKTTTTPLVSTPLKSKAVEVPKVVEGKKTDKVKEKDKKVVDKRKSKSPSKNNKMDPRRRRSSPRWRTSGGRRNYSPRRRSLTPDRKKRYSASPNRRSIKRSLPEVRRSPKHRRLSPDLHIPLPKDPPPPLTTHAPTIDSPNNVLKKSVADSTISDDLLPMPSSIEESHTNRFLDRNNSHHKFTDSPKRLPLDVRINEVLGLKEDAAAQPQMMPNSYSAYNYQQPPNYYHHHHPEFAVPPPMMKQVGNMIQIVPTEDFSQVKPAQKKAEVPVQKYVQVGNMVQIVPGQMPIEHYEQQPPKSEVKVEVSPEAQSAEAMLKVKAAERRAERERRREEREKRRKEKDKRRKEKEMRKQLKLKKKTEDMIKRALQLEVDNENNVNEEDDDEYIDDSSQLPAIVLAAITFREPGKSILTKSLNNSANIKCEKKAVVFADGIRPGEGTSPSGGEELLSPPPTVPKMVDDKRYKKAKVPKKKKKKKKKKIKVKVIKQRIVKNNGNEVSDEEDDFLPPPPPPPGSPPPHLFPPRIKSHNINNVHPNFANLVVPPQGQQAPINYQQLYRPSLPIIMPPPPPHRPLHPPPPRPHDDGPPPHRPYHHPFDPHHHPHEGRPIHPPPPPPHHHH